MVWSGLERPLILSFNVHHCVKRASTRFSSEEWLFIPILSNIQFWVGWELVQRDPPTCSYSLTAFPLQTHTQHVKGNILSQDQPPKSQTARNWLQKVLFFNDFWLNHDALTTCIQHLTKTDWQRPFNVNYIYIISVIRSKKLEDNLF